MADFIVDFGQDVRSAIDQCKSPRIVCLDNLQLLVHLRDSRLNPVMLRHVPVADEKLQCFVHLCIAKLEDFDCVCLAFKLCNLGPLDIDRGELDGLLLDGFTDLLIFHEQFDKM